MAQILVRNLESAVVNRLKKRAHEDGRSLQSEVKAILEKAVEYPVVDMETASVLAREVQAMFKTGRRLPNSTELIRKDRDR